MSLNVIALLMTWYLWLKFPFQLALAHLTTTRCTALQLIIIVTLIQRQRRYPRWKCKMNAHFCCTRYRLCRLYTSVHVSNVDKLKLAAHTRVVMIRHESRKSPENENEMRKDALCACVYRDNIKLPTINFSDLNLKSLARLVWLLSLFSRSRSSD